MEVSLPARNLNQMVKFTRATSIIEKGTAKASALLIINAYIKDCGSLGLLKMPFLCLVTSIRARQVRVKWKWVVI